MPRSITNKFGQPTRLPTMNRPSAPYTGVGGPTAPYTGMGGQTAPGGGGPTPAGPQRRPGSTPGQYVPTGSTPSLLDRKRPPAPTRRPSYTGGQTDEPRHTAPYVGSPPPPATSGGPQPIPGFDFQPTPIETDGGPTPADPYGDDMMPWGPKEWYDDLLTPTEPTPEEELRDQARIRGDLFENPRMRIIEQNIERAIQAAEEAQSRARADYEAQRAITEGQYGSQRHRLEGTHEAEAARLAAAYDAQHGRTGADYRAQFDRLDRAEGRMADRDLGMSVARGAGRSGVADYKDLERSRDFAIEHGGLSAQKAAALSGIDRQRTAGLEGLGSQHYGSMAGLSAQEAAAMSGLSFKEIAELDRIASGLSGAHKEAGDQRTGVAEDRSLFEIDELRKLEDRDHDRGVAEEIREWGKFLDVTDRSTMTPAQRWELYIMMAETLGETPETVADMFGDWDVAKETGGSGTGQDHFADWRSTLK